jgi:hypothetical protein
MDPKRNPGAKGGGKILDVISQVLGNPNVQAALDAADQVSKNTPFPQDDLAVGGAKGLAVLIPALAKGKLPKNLKKFLVKDARMEDMLSESNGWDTAKRLLIDPDEMTAYGPSSGTSMFHDDIADNLGFVDGNNMGSAAKALKNGMIRWEGRPKGVGITYNERPEAKKAAIQLLRNYDAMSPNHISAVDVFGAPGYKTYQPASRASQDPEELIRWILGGYK